MQRMRTGLGRLLHCTCASPDRCTCGAAQLARRGREPSRGGTLHVTNGASTGNSLQHGNLAGTVLVWSDLFAEGPLAPVEPAAWLRSLRARFWAKGGWGVEAALAAEMERRDEVFAEAMTVGRHVVVWLEHDLLDQLQLAHILATIVALGHGWGNVELIVVDEFEGHPGFRGLGELQPRELEALWPRRVPLRPEAAELGARAWAAAAAPDPTALAALLDTDTSALPLLAPALRRWLEELPDTAVGLALSERQILELLADSPRTRHELFFEHMERETVLFNGDAWFFDRIAGLGSLVETAGDRVRITDLGRRVLAGELDRVDVAGLDRWLGGTHLTPSNVWRRP
jgi:hypothetical protein